MRSFLATFDVGIKPTYHNLHTWYSLFGEFLAEIIGHAGWRVSKQMDTIRVGHTHRCLIFLIILL